MLTIMIIVNTPDTTVWLMSSMLALAVASRLVKAATIPGWSEPVTVMTIRSLRLELATFNPPSYLILVPEGTFCDGRMSTALPSYSAARSMP